jgi:hypothetical protein
MIYREEEGEGGEGHVLNVEWVHEWGGHAGHWSRYLQVREWRASSMAVDDLMVQGETLDDEQADSTTALRLLAQEQTDLSKALERETTSMNAFRDQMRSDYVLGMNRYMMLSTAKRQTQRHGSLSQATLDTLFDMDGFVRWFFRGYDPLLSSLGHTTPDSMGHGAALHEAIDEVPPQTTVVLDVRVLLTPTPSAVRGGVYLEVYWQTGGLSFFLEGRVYCRSQRVRDRCDSGFVRSFVCLLAHTGARKLKFSVINNFHHQRANIHLNLLFLCGCGCVCMYVRVCHTVSHRL